MAEVKASLRDKKVVDLCRDKQVSFLEVGVQT